MSEAQPEAPAWRDWLLSDEPASRLQARLGRGYLAWLAFARNPLAIVGLCIVLALLLVAAAAPWLATHSPIQQALTDRDLVDYAAALGLDADAVATALANGTYESNVREDFMGGVRSGVSGTPTSFINGVRYDGEYTLEALARAVQAAGRAAR